METERERILHIAEVMIRSKGAKLSMSGLAVEAGVSRTTLYQHFGSKESLLNVLYEECDVAEARSTRERLLDAVGTLLQTHTLQDFRLQDVAALAQTTPMTLHRHFGDRASLLQAFADERSPRMMMSNLVLDLEEPPEEVFARVATQFLEFARKYRGLVMTFFQSHGNEDELLAQLKQTPGSSRETMNRYLKALMEKGVLRTEPLEKLMPLFQGMVLTYVVQNPQLDEEEIPDIAALVARIFVRGLLPGREKGRHQ